jgi:hypothetical protein
MNYGSQARLSFDDGIRDTHLLAEGRKEHDELDRVDIVGNEDEIGLFVLQKVSTRPGTICMGYRYLNKSYDMVQTVLDSVRLLGNILSLLALGDGGSLLLKTLLLLGLAFWSVFVEELEALGSLVAIEDVLELRNGWWDLQAPLPQLACCLEEPG